MWSIFRLIFLIFTIFVGQINNFFVSDLLHLPEIRTVQEVPGQLRPKITKTVAIWKAVEDTLQMTELTRQITEDIRQTIEDIHQITEDTHQMTEDTRQITEVIQPD